MVKLKPYIQTNFTENYTINLYDATCKRAYTHSCKGSIELSDMNLPTGFYIYECTTPKGKTVGKLVIQN